MRISCFLKLFRGEDWSRELMVRIDEALQLGAEMFDSAAEAVIDGREDIDAQTHIYDMDKRINALQRDVRRNIVWKLADDCSESCVPTALIFMNVVKDAERIGDYMKNLYEVKDLQAANVDRSLYREQLGAGRSAIADLFARTASALEHSDEDAARAVIQDAREEAGKAEAAILDLLNSDLGTNDTVCLTLAHRFFKRIAMHMANIATSVVVPVDEMDFYDETS